MTESIPYLQSALNFILNRIFIFLRFFPHILNFPPFQRNSKRLSRLIRLYDTFVNCNCVATQWQQYSTHLHTNSTQNDTKQTVHRTTRNFGRVRAVPHLCGFYPDICLTTEEIARKNLSRGSWKIPVCTMKREYNTMIIWYDILVKCNWVTTRWQ